MLRRRAISQAGSGYKTFAMEITLTSANQTFTMPFTSFGSPSYDCTIYWGDGTSVNHNTTTAPTKTYTGAIGDKFVIEIEGRADRLYFNNGGSKDMVTKILSWGGSDFEGFTLKGNAFWGCSNLTELAEGGIKERLPITDFSFCFQNCSSLTSIPSGLFDNNTSVTNFRSCLQNCIKLQMRSDIFEFGNFLNKNIDWRNFLARTSFTGTQGTAPDIWNADYGTGTPNISNPPFGGAGNSTTSLSNYNDIPSAWK